jgi:hypothetical protein
METTSVRHETGLDLDEWLRAIAGVFVFASVILARFASPWWLLLTGFVGLNLLQSAFTKWCPMMALLRRLHVRE